MFNMKKELEAIFKEMKDDIMGLKNKVSELEATNKDTVETLNYLSRLNIKLENKIAGLQYPNGQLIAHSGCTIDQTLFIYWHYGEKYAVSIPSNYIDYAKTQEGFIFTDKDRKSYIIIPFGQDKYVKIPNPCIHE